MHELGLVPPPFMILSGNQWMTNLQRLTSPLRTYDEIGWVGGSGGVSGAQGGGGGTGEGPDTWIFALHPQLLFLTNGSRIHIHGSPSEQQGQMSYAAERNGRLADQKFQEWVSGSIPVLHVQFNVYLANGVPPEYNHWAKTLVDFAANSIVQR
ncbi:hypothetical protein B0H14DRAFT_2610629 [Mycena olivaceomarginata]|nr:hypothetical protein B0H14DRAFT_2610629 [Mycena olivaceomarginata]